MTTADLSMQPPVEEAITPDFEDSANLDMI